MGISIGGSLGPVHVSTGNLLKNRSSGGRVPTYREARLARLERPMRRRAKRRAYRARVARAKAIRRERRLAPLKWAIIILAVAAFWPFIALWYGIRMVSRNRAA